MSFVRRITSDNDLEEILINKASGLVIVYFHASWCRPSCQMGPVFARLSQVYRHVTFAQVDVDILHPVAEKYHITAMPTFVCIKNRVVVDTLVGANTGALIDLLNRHAPNPSSQGGSQGPGGDRLAAGYDSLLEYLDLSQVHCLNESTENTIRPILASKSLNTTAAFLQSDADEQLLLTITFNRTVRIRSIIIQSTTLAYAPKNIKFFVNKPALGFEDVENAQEPEAAQVLELAPDVVMEGHQTTLKFVRFQSVTSLHIFVASNHGGEDETRIDGIDIFGRPVETTRMGGFRRLRAD